MAARSRTISGLDAGGGGLGDDLVPAARSPYGAGDNVKHSLDEIAAYVASVIGSTNVADQRILGNISGGAAPAIGLTQAEVRTFLALGDAAYESISAYGASLIDAANAAAARTLLALGTAAVIDTGTSGAKIPLLDAANTWSLAQIFATLEIGHASDSTLARVSAGVLSIEGVPIVTTTANQTLTNKALTSPALTTPTLTNSVPATPSANVLGLYGITSDLFKQPAFIGENGLSARLARSPMAGGVSGFQAAAGVSSVTAFGRAGTPLTSGATVTARAPASTNMFTSMARLGLPATTTTAGSSTTMRFNNQPWLWIGNAAGLGGFRWMGRFGVSDPATVANSRMFVGLYSSGLSIGNVEPSSLLSMVGMACDAGETEFSIMHNDGSGTATKIGLGANFPSQTLSTDIYEVQFFCLPNGSAIQYYVKRINTGHTASGTISTDMPANTTFLHPQFWRNNGATALGVAFDAFCEYCETEWMY